jgi:cytochrome c-type biogenesis protein CcmH/NrfG
MQLFNVYRRANRPGDGEQLLQRMIASLPDNPEGYSLLTSFYRERGEFAKAADVVRRWLALHPRDQSAVNLLEDLEQRAREAGS